MSGLQVCAAVSSFALFAVCAYRLGMLRHPCSATVRCIGRWAFMGGCYFVVGFGVVWWWFDTWQNPAAGEWHLCMVRLGAAGLLTIELLRGTDTRERATDREGLA